MNQNVLIRGLVRVGVIRIRDSGKIKWPIHLSPWWIRKIQLKHPFDPYTGGWCGVFRNREGVIKWESGRLLPRRWGFYVLGLEIGDRG